MSSNPKRAVHGFLTVIAAIAVMLVAATCLTACGKADFEDDAIVVRSSDLKKDEDGSIILGTLHVSVENKSGSKQDVSYVYDVLDDSGNVIANVYGGVDDLRPGTTDESDVSIITTDFSITGSSVKSYKLNYAHHS
jgi:hypothetical protein